MKYFYLKYKLKKFKKYLTNKGYIIQKSAFSDDIIYFTILSSSAVVIDNYYTVI